MCEDTVFWDLNYAIKYKSLGTEEIRSKVLILMESLDERLFEHPNFVWLDHAAINEILDKRQGTISSTPFRVRFCSTIRFHNVAAR